MTAGELGVKVAEALADVVPSSVGAFVLLCADGACAVVENIAHDAERRAATIASLRLWIDRLEAIGRETAS